MMIKHLTLILTLTLLVGVASAQTPKHIGPPPINENTIVKDSAGTVYPYAVWTKLMMSGDAKLRSKDNGLDAPTFLLILNTSAEKDAMMASMPKPTDSDKFKTGAAFTHFREKAMDGVKIDTKALAGKVVVVNFWFIGCPPCRAEIPDLYKITQRYKDNSDVVFVSIALDEGYDIKDFLKDKQLGYHIIDNGRYVAAKYGVNLYPTNLVIDREGKIAFSSQGGWGNNPYWIKKSVDAALAAPVLVNTSAK